MADRGHLRDLSPQFHADGNGDGVGDIAGIRSHLRYLAELGVDAIWIAPWYPSPMKDGGYDISDYRDIDPVFGTLADADGLFEDAHALGISDDVGLRCPTTPPSGTRCSRRHRGAGPGSPERDRYYFRDGHGPERR